MPVAILLGGGYGDRRSVCRRRRCFHARGRLLVAGLGIEQHALERIELLTRAAVDPFQQQVHVVLLPLQTPVGFVQLLQQLHHELLQHRRVVGQQGGIGNRPGLRAHALLDRLCRRFIPVEAKLFPVHFSPRVDTVSVASRWPGRCPTAPATIPAHRIRGFVFPHRPPRGSERRLLPSACSIEPVRPCPTTAT